MLMQHGRVNRVWVNLVSIHGMPWTENMTLCGGKLQQVIHQWLEC